MDRIAEIVAQWASGVPCIVSVHLFGSRAKGTFRPDSDVDLAVVIEPDPGLSVKQTYDEHVDEWWSELREHFPMFVHLVCNRGSATPDTMAYVSEAGILLYSRREAERR